MEPINAAQEALEPSDSPTYSGRVTAGFRIKLKGA
jgi:hypothetical protein